MDRDRNRPERPQHASEETDDRAIRRGLRWSAALAASLVMVAIAVFAVLERDKPPVPVLESQIVAPDVRTDQEAISIPALPFVDITRAAGIDFVHSNGAAGDKLLPETMGGGAAFLDYDADGDPDILLVDSGPWPDAGSGGEPATRVRLYRNDGTGAFEDVTATSGLTVDAYGMGVATGDYDNDGFVDVFITAVGENRLFRNESGVYRDVTARAGVAGDAAAWSTSAAFFDYDLDGDLDLFVANYVDWSREIDLEVNFQLTGVGRAYGPPRSFAGTHPYLYRNEGDGTFRDVSSAAGVQVENPTSGEALAKGLAVAPVDVDGDGWLDVVLANDTVRNLVFVNNHDGTFREAGAGSGLAYDRNGAATGAMGIDAAYLDDSGDGRGDENSGNGGDQRLAIAIGNFANEMTSFYVSQNAPGRYADEAIGVGIGAPSRLSLTFGVFFFDGDLDGRLDFLQANGHLEDEINRVQSSQHYRQPAQLFWNTGRSEGATFAPVPAERVGDLATPIVGRGAAHADIDGDGDLDVLLTQIGGPPLLLRNEQRLGHHWLRVKLEGRPANRDGIGAVVEVQAGGRLQRRRVMRARSYLSQMEAAVTFGLGPGERIDAVRVVWPGGQVQAVTGARVDTTLTVTQEPLH